MARTRYQDLADTLAEQIAAGVFPPGQRLPGVRKLAAQFGVSVATARSALHHLEDRGLVAARSRSGHYVRRRPQRPTAPPERSRPEGEPTAVTGQSLVLSVVQAANRPDVLPLGAAVPHATFLPDRALRRAFGRAPTRFPGRLMDYAFPPGPEELRRASRGAWRMPAVRRRRRRWSSPTAPRRPSC